MTDNIRVGFFGKTEIINPIALLRKNRSGEYRKDKDVTDKYDFKGALNDVDRWAKHIIRGGKETVDIMQLEPESLVMIRYALRLADRLQGGEGAIKELTDNGWLYHGCDLYSFEDSGSMSGRDALYLHRLLQSNGSADD